MLKHFAQSAMKKEQLHTYVLAHSFCSTPTHTSGQKDFLNQRQVSFSYQIDLVFIVHLCECIHVIVPPIFDLNSHYKTMQKTVTLSKNFEEKKKRNSLPSLMQKNGWEKWDVITSPSPWKDCRELRQQAPGVCRVGNSAGMDVQYSSTS